MKVVFDTNIILDALLDRPDSGIARQLFAAVSKESIVGVVTANSITDIYYVSRKVIGHSEARLALFRLMAIFQVAAVDGNICQAALLSQISDFEDALLAVCAKSVDADYVVSRDKDFLQSVYSPVAIVTPQEMLVRINHPFDVSGA